MTAGRAARVIAVASTVALGGLAAPASAQEGTPGSGTGRVVDIERRTVDIVRRVQSISGDIKTEESPKQTEVTLAADVLFAFDQADLSPEAATRIDEVAGQITTSATGPVAIVGYTDAKGSDAYNADLSLRRATAVRDAMATKAPGIGFQVSGRGAADPVAPNQSEDGSDNPDGRALNRRVTITFARKG